ncbi:lipid A 3-O-deacylase [Rhodomicrobium udaipurense JA643]|nr:lipid A 3-O-deacylase [Rhodomicrobium udaipurense JA643]
MCAGLSAPAAALEAFTEANHPFWAIDEVRVGAFKQAIDDAPGEGGPAINLEVLSGRIPGAYENSILNIFMTPRLHIGGTVAFDKTNQFYWGATWDVKLTDRVFFETSFGGAAHDGPLSSKTEASYGCDVNFRESASLGIALSADWKLMATIDHMSNAGLCDTNRGLTNAGVRLGYKF